MKAQDQDSEATLAAALHALRDQLASLESQLQQTRENLGQAENALLQRGERIQMAARRTEDALYDWDLLTNAFWWQEGLGRHFGYASGAYDAAWRTERIHPDDRELVQQSLTQAIQGGETLWSREYRFRKGDSSYADILDRSTIVGDAQGRPVRIVGGLIDITEHKALEGRLRLGHKMDAIGRLAGGVAHNFNNLLTVMLGYAQLVLASLRRDDPNYPFIEEIKRAGDRAAELTSQLLAFSRQQILAPRILDLSTVIAEREPLVRGLLGDDIELVTVLAPGLPALRADPSQIEQVVVNLAANARDAMPQGGRLTIATGQVTLDPAAVRTWGEMPPGRYVTLTISDTGRGMDDRTLAHIFEPFFTTKEVGQGTGMGLASVFGIVKQSNGHIQVTSDPEQGTTFTIYFPAVEEAEPGTERDTKGRSGTANSACPPPARR